MCWVAQPSNRADAAPIVSGRPTQGRTPASTFRGVTEGTRTPGLQGHNLTL